MTSDGYAGDERQTVRLLADLTALYQNDDPVPAQVLDAARAAFGWLDFGRRPQARRPGDAGGPARGVVGERGRRTRRHRSG